MKYNIMRIIKFAGLGLVTTALDFCLLFLLTEAFHIYYIYSAFFSFVGATVFNYFMSKSYVFMTDSQNPNRFELLYFLLFSTIGLVINQVLVFVSVEYFSLYYLFAKLLATIVVMIWNYNSRRFLFKA
ncbi:GtrA family protein [Aerococcus kribbianus]|uniref:GtrA family protein n=1 Tax=Aerococcus kribbianus TaxID=2999064 RepID=UPI003AA7E3E8